MMDDKQINISVEESGQLLRQKLVALFYRLNAGASSVGIEMSDGTIINIDPTKKWEVEIGVDYISVEPVLDFHAPNFPRIIPFTSIRSICVVD
jgi:hypothetical protein